MSKRAPFIVIEGLDRSGKSTQTSLLVERLKALGHSVELLKFPGNMNSP
jgi:dTMP kinase